MKELSQNLHIDTLQSESSIDVSDYESKILHFRKFFTEKISYILENKGNSIFFAALLATGTHSVTSIQETSNEL